jgi:hypothetical protein
MFKQAHILVLPKPGKKKKTIQDLKPVAEPFSPLSRLTNGLRHPAIFALMPSRYNSSAEVQQNDWINCSLNLGLSA